MTDIVISGIRGRMGQALVDLAERRTDMRIVAGIGREALSGEAAVRLGVPRVVTMTDAAEVAAAADVVIDVSSAAATGELLERAVDALAGKALVVGTTGLAEATEQRLQQMAWRTAVLTAANFSIGVNLLLVLTEQMARVLGAADYDVEIVEAHHGRKVDAPSGTALALGSAAAQGRGIELAGSRRDGRSGAVGSRQRGEIGFHAIRGGGVVGEHHVLFLGERERIELKHEALDRSLFAEGALRAAAWLAGRGPGRYEMRQVLGL